MLNATQLKNEIISQMEAKGFKQTKENANLAEAIAQAVVAHIQSNAEVTTTGNQNAQKGTIK